MEDIDGLHSDQEAVLLHGLGDLMLFPVLVRPLVGDVTVIVVGVRPQDDGVGLTLYVADGLEQEDGIFIDSLFVDVVHGSPILPRL